MDPNEEQVRPKKGPTLQPLMTPLRIKRGTVGVTGASQKPKPKGLSLQVNVPDKKPHDPKEFEITDSGSFSVGKFKIAMNGMKNDDTSSTRSNSTGSTSSPDTGGFSTDDEYNPDQYGQTRKMHTEVEQLEERFRHINTNQSTPPRTAGSGLDNAGVVNTPPSRGGNQVKLSPRPQQDILYDDLTILKKSKLGSGATANVIRVIHNHDQKPYALKIVPLYQGDIQPKQIISEIQSLYESMTCPFIVRFYEAFHREGSIRILLEYMDCGSLDDVYRTVGKIPEQVLSQITYQILQGLVYLESKKIVHRDIKPANILLNRDGMAKISDFGMSKQLTASLQAFKTFQGTFMYMSPERLKGEEHGFDSDIWSLGVSIAECAIGRFPFDLEQFNLWNVLKCITDNGLNIQVGECTPELLQFVRACTMVDPLTRPNASKLLQFDFITKHNRDNNKTATTEWIQTVFLPERRRKQKAKHTQKLLEKEQLAQQQQLQNIVQQPQNTAQPVRKLSGNRIGTKY